MTGGKLLLQILGPATAQGSCTSLEFKAGLEKSKNFRQLKRPCVV